MLGHFADEYLKAAITEVEALEVMNALEVANHSEDMNFLLFWYSS